VSEWIDVKRELPPMNGSAYLTYRSGYNAQNADKNGFELDTAQGQAMWYTLGRYGFGITHWMPLPAPPEASQRDTK
jgi:hypothetical protein